MDIGPISPVIAASSVRPAEPIAPVDRLAAQRQATAEQTKTQVAEVARAAPRDPAPALRPTIQDRIDITRALLVMRGVSDR